MPTHDFPWTPQGRPRDLAGTPQAPAEPPQELQRQAGDPWSAWRPLMDTPGTLQDLSKQPICPDRVFLDN